jgi:hypothetical protein
VEQITEILKNINFQFLGQEMLPFFQIINEFLKDWWWLILPFVLIKPFLYFWLFWRQEAWGKSIKSIVLEIKMPKEILKPIKAMEQVFSAFWGCNYDPADWWEKWIEGKDLPSFSLEIASIDGEPHFFIRIQEGRRNAVESAIYSQYPDAEISVVEDYAKMVPQDIPNKNWKMWGCDYELIKDDMYPIKTYSKFFEEKPDAPKEEKRLDPMATLLEGMGKCKPGEQLWVQISATPMTKGDKAYDKYIKKAKVLIGELAQRPGPPKPPPIIKGAALALVKGEVLGAEEKHEEIMPPEMKLTPGEREILAGVEKKIAEYSFECFIRFMYVAKNEVYFGGAKGIPFAYFNQFATANLNALKPWAKTITKIHKHWFLPWNLLLERRLFVRKRNLFRHYVDRNNPLHPFAGGTFIMNAEELATIFHFPGKGVAPAPFVPRIESKKGEAPPGLPTE